MLIPWPPSLCLPGAVLTNAVFKCVGICWGIFVVVVAVHRIPTVKMMPGF